MPFNGRVSLATLIHVHALGTTQQEDRLAHATPERPELLHLAEMTEDWRQLLITSTPDAGSTALTTIDLTGDGWVSRVFVKNLDEAAKPNSVGPHAWLADTLARVPDHKITGLNDLLPGTLR